MISFPNAKINLGLQVTEKRSDGFHNIETVFYPIDICDALEFIESKITQLTTSGIEIPGSLEDNLILKAYHLLKKNTSESLPPLHFHLHKHIPLGAGLGGGSSDATAVLTMLNKHFELCFDDEKLISLASQLGSDCAFFIKNKPCKAVGKGDELEEINLDLSEYSIQLVKPNIHINTAWAYAHITPTSSHLKCWDTIKMPIGTWKENLTNQFELPVLNHYPILHTIKEQFYQQGALYAAMSGSGSTFFALMPKNKKANILLDIGFEEYYSK